MVSSIRCRRQIGGFCYLRFGGVKSILPEAPPQVYERPDGPIDVVIVLMYRNIQPCGDKQGFILTGTNSSIVAQENVLAEHAKTLVNCVQMEADEMSAVPVMSCNRAVASLRISEFF